MKEYLNLEYANKEACKLDIFTPETDNFETIIWFHGGGLEKGDKGMGKPLAEDFTKAGFAFVSVEYTMYPTAKYPEFIIDVAKAVAYVKNNIAKYGGNGNALYVSGQSAGAWMATMLCVNETYLLNEGVNPLEIRGWLIDSAQVTAHFNVLLKEQNLDHRLQRINEFAPLYYINEKTRFTKMLLMFYENDMPCRYEQNMLFYKAILEFNKDATISYKVLKGTHCYGSNRRDENGEFEYVQTSLKALSDWKGIK